jgi:hypothetical protein
MPVMLFLPSLASGQDGRLPNVALFGGAGITNASGPVHASVQFGADLDQAVPWSHSRPIFPVGYLLEGGYIGPVSSFSAGSALLSLNYLAKFNFSEKIEPRVTPFITGGYTRLFGTGNAINFGGGLDLRIAARTGLRFEVRDYRQTGTAEHNFAIRIALLKILAD